MNNNNKRFRKKAFFFTWYISFFSYKKLKFKKTFKPINYMGIRDFKFVLLINSEWFDTDVLCEKEDYLLAKRTYLFILFWKLLC